MLCIQCLKKTDSIETFYSWAKQSCSLRITAASGFGSLVWTDEWTDGGSSWMNSEVFRDILSGQISSSHRSEQTSCNKCFLFKQSSYLQLFWALRAFWLLNTDDLKYVKFPALVFQSAECSYTYMKLYLEEVRHPINSITFKLKGICTFFPLMF